jgi:hypothetical protein
MTWHPLVCPSPHLRAERGEIVRPEPFEQIELSVGIVFGDDPPES